MASGPRASFEVAEPLLKNFGKVFFVGEKAGLAQVAKLGNNLLAAAAMAISSEALVMGVKAGNRSEDHARNHQCRQRPQQRDTGQVS